MADNLQPGDIVYQNSPRSTSAQAVGSDNQLHGVQLVASPGGDIIYQEDESSNIAMALGDDGNYHRVMLVYSLGGEGGGGASLDKIIIKSKTIPAASSTEYGRMRIYAGEDDGTYTHGYIYECKGTVSYEANIAYQQGTFASEDFDKAGQLIVDAGVPEPELVTGGSMTYAEAASLWTIVFTDENSNPLNSPYSIYTDDLIQTYDILPVIDPSDFVDGQVVTFTVNNIIRHVSNPYWDRIDVQPSSGGGVTTRTVTLSSANWTNDMQVVSCPGVTASNTVVVGPTPASGTDYGAAGIICTAQAANSLTFTCDTTPSANIDVNVIIM